MQTQTKSTRLVPNRVWFARPVTREDEIERIREKTIRRFDDVQFSRSGRIGAFLIRTDVCAFYVGEITNKQLRHISETFDEDRIRARVPVNIIPAEDLAGMSLTEHQFAIDICMTSDVEAWIALPQGGEHGYYWTARLPLATLLGFCDAMQLAR